jgi:hypothetical protein
MIVEWLNGNDIQIVWKVVILFKVISGELRGSTVENHEYISQDSRRCLVRDSNRATSEYKSKALQFEPTCSTMKFIELSISVKIERSETKGTTQISSYALLYYPKRP